MNYCRRITDLRKKMNENNLDAFFLCNMKNIRYFSGFCGSFALALVTERESFLLTDSRYLEQAKKETQGFIIRLVAQNAIEKLLELLNMHNDIARIAYEGETLLFRDYLRIKERYGGELIDGGHLIFSLRSIKDDQEIAYIRKAAEIASEGFNYILNRIKPGITEKKLALDLEFYMKGIGAESLSFETILASGWRSALPHGIASDKVLEKGDLITFDFGCTFRGYCSDMTRTVIIGRPNKKQKLIYDVVQVAQRMGREVLMAGKTGKEVDFACREYIADCGFKEYFQHGTGHGVGLDVHEKPIINPASDNILEKNQIVTIEPGIYIAGFGGVRIEDLLLIGSEGAENLISASHNLIII